MDKFTASNEATVEQFAYSLNVKMRSAESWLEPWAVNALREFFRAEEDERLGRWRRPEYPTYVVREDNVGELTIFNEKSMTLVSVTRDEVESGYNGWGRDTARAYIDAHPVKKPWHDAKPGELWRIELPDIGENSYVAGDYTFRSHDHAITMEDFRIISARRIWPQD